MGVSAQGWGVCQEGCLPRSGSAQGVCLPRRGVSAQEGVSAQDGGVCPGCKNITLPQLRCGW